ncbi:hypothetical protein Dxin01_04274 [Deinococcus xinjiangensis]|uniref:Uncharacterized protein n=1 Tax=Deinococcus xinjiangensis TaxID=457454 RepID=A0ABP9VH05_9DEIO
MPLLGLHLVSGMWVSRSFGGLVVFMPDSWLAWLCLRR